MQAEGSPTDRTACRTEQSETNFRMRKTHAAAARSLVEDRVGAAEDEAACVEVDPARTSEQSER